MLPLHYLFSKERLAPLMIYITLVYTVVWEIFAYRNFHVLNFRVQKTFGHRLFVQNFFKAKFKTSML